MEKEQKGFVSNIEASDPKEVGELHEVSDPTRSMTLDYLLSSSASKCSLVNFIEKILRQKKNLSEALEVKETQITRGH